MKSWLAGGVMFMAMAWGQVAHADSEASGKETRWVLTKDGKNVLGSESVRVVKAASGNMFASGMVRTKGKDARHRVTHIQRDSSGKLMRYQRLNGTSSKASGVRIFDWEGQLRVVKVNGSGKPQDIGTPDTARLWDGDVWHLLDTWSLPKKCQTQDIAVFDVGSQSVKTASLTCEGTQTVTNAQKSSEKVNHFKLKGLSSNPLELWVTEQGALIGARSPSVTMLREKYALSGVVEALSDDTSDEATERASIKERGVGE